MLLLIGRTLHDLPPWHPDMYSPREHHAGKKPGEQIITIFFFYNAQQTIRHCSCTRLICHIYLFFSALGWVTSGLYRAIKATAGIGAT